ncbi:MAG TPA: acetylxylan esterase [bacterium]|nr:acetylxylan esterase [bacterium]
MKINPYLRLITSVWMVVSAPLYAGALSPVDGMRDMRYSRRTAAEAVRWQHQLRQQCIELLHLQDLMNLRGQLPLRIKRCAEADRSGYRMMELEIAATPGRRIAVVFTRPSQGAGPFPAVVCVHGHGGSRHVVYDVETIYKGFAHHLASAGYVTISTEVGQHQVFEPGRTLIGERLWDLLRCVDYLRSLKEVDVQRIGCAGLSLGGEMAMWLAAMDEGIAATVSAGFLTLMDQMEKNHCPCWKFDGLRQRADWPDIYSLIAPRPLQCQNGWKEPPSDFVVSFARLAMAQVRPIYQDLGRPNAVELHAHCGAHEIDLAALMDFFDRTLRVRP